MSRTPRARRSRLTTATAAACTAAALTAATALWNHEGSVAEAGPVSATGALGTWGEIDQPEEGTAVEEDFFQPPDPLPAGEPGDVIRAEPADAFTDALRIGRFPADVWRVMYLSTDGLGEPMAVTATVMVPTAPWKGEGERPLLAYAIGTHGIGDQCAPANGLEQGLEYEASLMERFVDDGYALVVTDYEGFGTPGDHTFMVGRSQGPAVLDSLRAATRLDEAGIPADSPMGVNGFSQGGGSAVWAAQLHPEYAPELPLVGVAAGAVPSDLNQVAGFLDGGSYFSLVGLAAIGFSSAYPELPLEERMTEEGVELMDTLRGSCTVDAIPHGMFRSMDGITTSELLNSPEWQARLAENLPGETAPTVPLFMYHSALDDAIPIGQAEELRDTYCAAGANVRWRRTYSGSHVMSLFLDYDGAHDWMADRFTGEPANSTC
ncbi:lipase family protein [Nocardiopsis sp. EMB25]|uniref:lipase family protein n=1 Tax=Nocardiopsis TaxID=2013 RepID=UPI000346C587|nr:MULTISPECIES: lipase family protein [Nocardiopsis]MCY9787176.1 lipase family protein [Nocardiopsis sp. EMB25]